MYVVSVLTKLTVYYLRCRDQLLSFTFLVCMARAITVLYLKFRKYEESS